MIQIPKQKYKYVLSVLFIRVVLGAIFIFSASVKLLPIEPFEYTFVEVGVSNWTLAPFIARFFIILEFAIGALLILHLWPKSTLKIAMWLLVIFTIYLIFLMLQQGNTGNCGCFGNAIKMTPLQAIIKNILMLGLGLILVYLPQPFQLGIWNKLGFLPIVCSISVVFFLNPPSAFIVNLSSPETVNYPFQTELIKDLGFSSGNIDLSKDKHIVCFFSLTCPHCRTAGSMMHLVKSRLKDKASIVMIINGDKADETSFFEDTKAQNIPYMHLNGASFPKLSGYTLPMIAYIENGIVKKKYNGENISENEIKSLFQIP
jgi:hypothetical protein